MATRGSVAVSATGATFEASHSEMFRTYFLKYGTSFSVSNAALNIIFEMDHSRPFRGCSELHDINSLRTKLEENEAFEHLEHQTIQDDRLRQTKVCKQ